MTNDGRSDQSERSAIQNGAQNAGFSRIAATVWAAPSILERNAVATLPDEFPTVSFNHGEESETAPDAPNDLEIRPSETAPDAPNDLEGDAPGSTLSENQRKAQQISEQFKNLINQLKAPLAPTLGPIPTVPQRRTRPFSKKPYEV